jgi:hypothetical protein
MRRVCLTLTLLTIILIIPLSLVQAQDSPPVQEVFGSLAPEQTDIYVILGMKKGQTLDALMENTSGNLDPILSILSGDTNLLATLESFQKDVANLIATSANPLVDLPAIRDKYSLAWDDDSGPPAAWFGCCAGVGRNGCSYRCSHCSPGSDVVGCAFRPGARWEVEQ